MKDKSDRFDEEMVDHRQEGRACQKRGHRKLFITCEDCHQVINQATFKAPNEWISINDVLPESGQECLCYANGRHFKALFSGNDFLHEFVEFIGGQRLSQYVSHWMTLPEPPK